MKELLKRLIGRKPDKLPEFLVKKPRAGKITGNLDEATPAERRFFEEMRDLGNDVEIVPRGVGRTPDVRLNGKPHDLKTISGVKRTDEEGLSSAISSRILDARGQARDIVVNARDQAGMTRDVAERAIKRAFGVDAQKGGIDSITIFTPEGPISTVRKP